MSLTIRRTAGARSITLQLRGDLDLATAPEVVEAIDSIADSYGRLVLDLSKLAFIDSTGVRVLVRSKEELARHGVQMELSQVPSHAEKAFWLLRVEGLAPQGRHYARL